MSERYIDIPNWDRFQHKDVWRKSGGRPPWIKAYTNLLHDDGWLQLAQAERGILLGLWLMYASAGKSVAESVANRYLVGSESDQRYWKRRLDSLNRAGFIEFLSQPISAPVAPRVEERREENSLKDQRTPSEPKAGTEWARQREKELEQERPERGSGWVDNLSSYTGCRIVRGEVGISHVYDPLGTEPKPADWPYPTPTRSEIAQALLERGGANVARAS